MAKNKIISVDEFKEISSSRNEGCAPIWSLKINDDGENRYVKMVESWKVVATKSVQMFDSCKIEHFLEKIKKHGLSVGILGVVCDINLAKRLGLGF